LRALWYIAMMRECCDPRRKGTVWVAELGVRRMHTPTHVPTKKMFASEKRNCAGETVV
jgi:hypothetical protein